MPSIAPFGDATSAPKQAVRCAKPIPWVKTPAADQTPRVLSVQNMVPSAQYANSQWSAARIHTAGATGVPFRHVQPAVVDRARAQAGSVRSMPNTMPNTCRSGPASRASYHRTNRPNAVGSNQLSQQTPCHRCRHRRNRLMTVPVRRLPLANPSEEKRKARPPARRRVPRQRRPHPRFGQLTRAPCRSHPMTAQFPGLQFCCVNHGKGNEASPAPTWRAPCRHLSQRPCCPTPNPKAFAYRSYPK